MVVGYAPGGGSDIMGRMMAPQITEALGHQATDQNLAGAAQHGAPQDSAQHLSGELLKIRIGVDFTHIPYKGSAPSMTALASGEVDFSFNNIPAAQPLMIPGRIRALGITSAKRSPLLPELPTLIEGGLPGFITQTWYGVLAPAGTPGAVINTLNAVIVKAIRNDEFRARIAQTGADTITETPEYFRRMLKEEIERWAIVVKASKAKAE